MSELIFISTIGISFPSFVKKNYKIDVKLLQIMLIDINDSRSIAVMQDEFHQLFPYLKIEFLQPQFLYSDKGPRILLCDPSKTLFACRTTHAIGSIEVSAQMSVKELENCFFELFGLKAKVYRKSGKAWIETTLTDF